MTRILFRLSLAALALSSVSAAAVAADVIPPPPPPPEMRPAAYDWNGPYIGGFVAAVFEEGEYVRVPDCLGCAVVNPDLTGEGFAGGVIAGWNFDMDGLVFGIEGDWGWGGKIADNNDVFEDSKLDLDNIATLRARFGVAFDDALFYIAGGVAFAELTFDALVDCGCPAYDKDSEWLTGWTIGAGFEYAFTDTVHARLEYLYVDLEDADFRIEDSAGVGSDITHEDEMHILRAAVTWNFTI